MKTKLTLFVAVLAAALFGMGCASTPKGPPIPRAVEFNGHWYAYLFDPISWDEANKRCKKLGGHLVIIDSAEENEFVWKLADHNRKGAEHAWLGASDSRYQSGSADRVFKWVPPSGKRLSETYSNWRPDALAHTQRNNEQGVVVMHL